MVAHSLDTFRGCGQVSEIILIVRSQDVEAARRLVAVGPGRQTEKVVCGGPTRQESVALGLAEVTPGIELVAVHDGARPLATLDLVERCLAAAEQSGAAVAAIPLSDTIRRAAGDESFQSGAEVVERVGLWAMQTPQVFAYELLARAYQRAAQDGFQATDDAALVERLGREVQLAPGSPRNLKVTTPEDVEMAEALLVPHAGSVRTGFGYDVHRLAPGRRLVLAGVEFVGGLGLLGHSDADVVAHACCNALLGAAAAGDLGSHFPDTDPQYAGVSSLELLRRSAKLVQGLGYRVANLDSMVVAEQPRIAPQARAMAAHLAQALGVAPEQVSVKATTTEGLGFAGQGQGIACYAVATLERKEPISSR